MFTLLPMLRSSQSLRLSSQKSNHLSNNPNSHVQKQDQTQIEKKENFHTGQFEFEKNYLETFLHPSKNLVFIFGKTFALFRSKLALANYLHFNHKNGDQFYPKIALNFVFLLYHIFCCWPFPVKIADLVFARLSPFRTSLFVGVQS